MNYRCKTNLQEIEKYLRGAGVVAFDFETAPLPAYRDDNKAALDAHRSHIVGVSLSVAEGSAIYVPLRHLRGPNADPEQIIPFLRNALWMNPAVVKIAHNLSFEAMFLYALGVVVQPPCYDTIAAAQMTLKTTFEFRALSDSGLKKLVPELLGDELPTFEDVTEGRFFDELASDDSDTVRYACADSDYALRLYRRFNEWFDAYLPRHRWIVENIESPTAVYCGLMKYNGLLMDETAMIRKQGECAARLLELREKIHAMTGGVEIGANAGTQAFKDYLFKTLGLPVLKTTAKNAEHSRPTAGRLEARRSEAECAGTPGAIRDAHGASIDDQTMVMLAEWCAEHRPELVPLFELVQEYRKWSKLKTTYIDGYLRFINPASGRIHPDLLPLATETGRFACRRPNLQNQCQPGNDYVGVRNFIVSPEGWLLMEADYSQVELRIVAYLSQDAVMLDAYKNGEDIHSITTSAVFGISREEAADKHHSEYKHRRTVAKGTMFGILYGIGAKGLSVNLKASAGVRASVEQCEQYIAGIKARYTNLAAWQQYAKETARRRQYAQTALGRRRYLPGIRSQDFRRRASSERMAMNTPVQGLAADCLKLAMGRLVKTLADKPYIRPVMTVHDSLVFEVRADHVDEAAALVKGCMEALPPLENFMPLVAEVAVGERYGELE